jgi:hypothetical protein
VEVTFSHYGERGSIDVLAFHPTMAALLVVEVKSELTSLEETLRRLDAKVRLAPAIAGERLDWHARSTSRLLVIRETTTARSRLAAHAVVLDMAFPLRGLPLRHWLRMPDRSGAGIRLLALNDGRSDKRRSGGSHRVRRPRNGPHV